MKREQLLTEGSRLGEVHLAVTDGERSRQFWTRYVGLQEQPSTDGTIRLGVGDSTLIVLHPGAQGPVVRRRTGLYHVAIHVPDQKALATLVARLATLRFGQSPTDHTSTMATYFSDPDGNGIEITFETPYRGEMLILPDGRPVARLKDGTERGVTEALDIDELFSVIDSETDLDVPLPAGTRIGHVHLHVQDIEAGKDFYVNVVGMHSLLHMAGMGMSDFGIDQTTQPHSFAINEWNSPMAAPRPEGTAGLIRWQLEVPDASALAELWSRLEAANWPFEATENGLLVADPSANQLEVVTAG